jgi:hypothetical protein
MLKDANWQLGTWAPIPRGIEGFEGSWQRSRQQAWAENELKHRLVTMTEDRGTKMVPLETEGGSRKWAPPVHSQAILRHSQPHLSLKQQQVRLAAVTGTGRKILCPTIRVL